MPELVDPAAQDFDTFDFDTVVRKIKAKNFSIITLPDKNICKEYDIRSYCASDGVFARM